MDLTNGEISFLIHAVYSHQEGIDRQMYIGDPADDIKLEKHLRVGDLLIKKLEQKLKSN